MLTRIAPVALAIAVVTVLVGAAAVDTTRAATVSPDGKCILGCLCVSPFNCPCCGYQDFGPNSDPIEALNTVQQAGVDISAHDLDEEMRQRQQATDLTTRTSTTVREDCSQYNTWWDALKTLLGFDSEFHACMCRNGSTAYCD